MHICKLINPARLLEKDWPENLRSEVLLMHDAVAVVVVAADPWPFF